jgi:hypothetical protein
MEPTTIKDIIACLNEDLPVQALEKLCKPKGFSAMRQQARSERELLNFAEQCPE